MKPDRKYYVLINMFLCVSLSMTGCINNGTRPDGLPHENYQVGSLIKTDMGEVIEVHVEESRIQLRELMIKLYKRNPRELARSRYANTIDENIVRLFDLDHNWDFEEFPGVYGGDLILLTFSSGYQGDRVFSLMAGLLFMLMEAYNNKRNFYLFQAPDPQNVYNLARNIEITVWKLGNSYDENGELYLYSNSIGTEDNNLSYERLFGKLIGLQDTMAIIISGRANRTITKVIQQMASAIFLPIL
jgi:hypothetical protein